jgi:hypothetical protein
MEISEKVDINNSKKKVTEIFIKKDSIPSKEDILRLCSHGMYNKINLINHSYFTLENVNDCIKHMHTKINEIKKWREEPENNNESSKKRFKSRIDSIYKTIRLFKNKHLEYLSNTILSNTILNNPIVNNKFFSNKPKIDIINQKEVQIKNQKEIDDLINDGWVKVGKRD